MCCGAQKATAKDAWALSVAAQEEWAEKLALILTMLTEEVGSFCYAKDRASKSECLFVCVRDNARCGRAWAGGAPAAAPSARRDALRFKLAIEAMEGGDDRRRLYELAEAYRPAHEALQLAPFGHPSNELCDGILADIQQK